MKSIMIALGLTGLTIAVLLISAASSADDDLLEDDSYIPKPRA
ncbi:hypothetical protein [Pontibacter brevis]